MSVNPDTGNPDARVLAALCGVARIVAGAASSDEAMSAVLEELGELPGWEYGTLWRVGTFGDRLVCAHSWCRPGLNIGTLADLTRHAIVTRREGLPGWVWATGEPRWVADLDVFGVDLRTRLAVSTGLRQAVAFPVRSPHAVVGVVEFLGRAMSPPDDALQETMAAVGALLGRAVVRESADIRTARLDHVVGLSRDLVAMSDVNGRLMYLNDAGRRTLGTGDIDLSSTGLRDLCDLTLADRISRRAIPAALGEGSWAEEVVLRRFDGVPVRVALTLVAHRLPNGEPDCLFAIAHALQGRQDEDARTLQAHRTEVVGQLAGGIAHDFNNLLTAIYGLSELAVFKIEEGDPLRDDMKEIMNAALRAERLNRQLQAFSRRLTLEPTALDLNDVVRDLHAILRSVIGKRVGLRLQFGEHLGRIKADRGQIEQVILNLAINARDAMPRGGELVVETANVDAEAADAAAPGDAAAPASGPCVALSVRDTGTGMDAATLSRIFERYFTTKRMGEGTGIGLATVHDIVAQSGGAIRVDSTPGRGTCFRITFPRVSEDATVAPTSEPPAARGERDTVLVVSEDAMVLDVVRAALSPSGHRVLGASRPEEALALCEADASVGLVICDEFLTSISGGEMVTRLARVRRSLRALMIEGEGGDSAVGFPNEAIAGVLHKPFDATALLRTVRDLLADGPIASDSAKAA